MKPVLTFGQRQQALQGLPFYGKTDFNFVAAKSPFNNGIAIKLLPLSDLSRPQSITSDEFEDEIKDLNRNFKLGTRISGVKVNSQFRSKDREPEQVYGKFEGFKIDKETNIIRAFVRDPKTLRTTEVYPETLTRLTESRNHLAKTFLEFVI